MRIWERMKTKLGVMIVLALLLIAAAGVAMAASYPFTGVIKDDTNMRSTASSYASNIIRRIPEGDYVTVTGETGNFYRITYDGKTGYVFKQYVEKTSEIVSSGTTGLTATGYPYNTISTDSVNLRKSASTSAKRLTTIPKGASITVHQISGAWAQVTYAGKTGWVVKEYIQVATIVAPTPTPAPGSSNIGSNVIIGTTTYQLLQNGSRGDQVTALQEALIELGFLRGTADGIFGSGTANAIMSFQRKNGYPITGTADANLQALIFNGKPLNASGKKTEIKTLPAIDGLNVRSGDKGVIVRRIQNQLKLLGYYTGAVSGTYDAKTVTAVKAFQQKNGLKVDGICGEGTQKLLFGAGMSSSATATPTPTPTPTPVPPMEKPTGTVRSGSKGENARLVQQRLIDLKYLSGRADGAFGSQSVAALKAFQLKNGLVADGVAGSGTNAVLFSYKAIAADYVAPATPAPATPTPTPAPITKDNVVIIKKGVIGSAVLRLQLRLEELGYYTSSRDSKCETDDVAAIRLFQAKNGLSQDGIAGYDTQVRLYSDNAIMYDGRLAGSLTVAYETLKKGMTGDAVKAMQARLVELGYLSGTPDGIFGTSTAEAVYYFQKNNGLVRDSVAGADTLKKLFSTSAVANNTSSAQTPTPQPTTPIATIPTGLLQKGDESDAVKALQQRLISLGYLSGKADGIFGAQTYRAVKEFQKANALYADGVAGSQTIAALNGSNSNTGNTGNTSNTGSSNNTGLGTSIVAMARSVKYEYWYSTVRNECRKYPYCTLFDPESGISWQVHMFSYGKHAEIEPLTAADTEKMYKAVGYQKWTPKPVWVIFADGTIRIATTHSVPHEVQHRTDNNFPGHACLHFPRTMAQVTSIGPYATKHQNAVDKAWAELQASLQ